MATVEEKALERMDVDVDDWKELSAKEREEFFEIVGEIADDIYANSIWRPEQ